MKKTLLMIVIALAAGMGAMAQTPGIEWEKSLGGSGDEEAYSIRQTTDGGYIVAGTSYSNDGDVTDHIGFSDRSDYWIVKLDNTGAIEWEKSLGGIGEDRAYSIQQTTDGGYIVAGTSYMTGNHGLSDYLIVKLNNTGTIEWEKSLGGSGEESAFSIQQTTDGGYIVAGWSDSNDGDITESHGGGYYFNADGEEIWIPYNDYWIVKLDNTGTIEWEKSLGGTNDDYAESIQQTADGGYIVAGFSYSIGGDRTEHFGNSDYWVVKLGVAGAIEWEKTLGGSGYDWAYSIQQTADGGYIVAGKSESTDGDVTNNQESSDYWIVKLDNTGAIEWEKSLGGTDEDGASSIQQTSDGGYIVAGYSESSDGDVTGHHGSNTYADYWIVKLNATGAFEWEKSLGGSGGDGASSIQQTSDGGYIVAGETFSTGGDVTGNHGGSDMWIVKLGGASGIHDIEQGSSELFSLYPNPNKGIFTLEGTAEPGNYTISITNLLGQELHQLTENVQSNKLKMEIATGTLTPGIYFLKVNKEGTRVAVKQFAIQ